MAGAVGALYGPLHGGANEAVLRMLERIGKVDNIPGFIEGVKNRKEKMFGFGHRCGHRIALRMYHDGGMTEKYLHAAGRCFFIRMIIYIFYILDMHSLRSKSHKLFS